MSRLRYPAPGLTPSKVKWLLEGGAPVDRFRGKAREWANEIAQRGDVTLDRETVSAMMSAGADTNEFDGQARRWAEEFMTRSANPRGECDPQNAFRTELYNRLIIQGEFPGRSMTFAPGSAHVVGCPEQWPAVEARVESALRRGVKLDLLKPLRRPNRYARLRRLLGL